MGYKVLNNAFTTLAATLSNVATSMTVSTGHGDRFPVIAGADYTYVTLEDVSGNIEIVKVTARATTSDVFTIERAQDGTTARSWASGDIVELRMIALLIDTALAHVDDTSGAHLASAITNTPAGTISATTVQAAITELDSDITALASAASAATTAVSNSLTAHLNDTSDAHDASAISYAGGTGMSATDVEAAIDELATEKMNTTGGTFSGDIIVPDEAYDATAWNASLEAPTKNAVRDKIEAVIATIPLGIEVAVRQSIQYGAIASGIADLIPQSQIGNTIATGVTLAANFFVSVGNGFNTDGSQKNVNRIRGSTLNVPNLTASVTCYIWYDANADTAGFVTVADAFQYGGTIPVTNNQYTYDYLNHIMYLGNGSSASQSNRLIVAEVDTDGTVVTAIRVRPYAGHYDSGFTATLTSAGGTYTHSHNMGTTLYNFEEVIECTTNDGTYVVGDQLRNLLGLIGGSTDARMASIITRNNTLIMRRPSNTAYVATNATTGASASLTAASWKYKTIIKRLF